MPNNPPETLPKFHTGMMLTLGVVVGMIAYLLVIFAQATSYPDAAVSYGTFSPTPVTAGTKVTFTTRVTNYGGSQAPLPLLTVCIDKQAEQRRALDCKNDPDSFEHTQRLGVETVHPGQTESVSWEWVPDSDPYTRFDVFVYVTGLYNDSNTSNDYRQLHNLEVQPSLINLVSKWVSYGPAKTVARASQTLPTGYTLTGEPTVWVVKEGASARFYTNITNIGARNANLASTTRFCIDNTTCSTDASLVVWNRNVSTASPINAGSYRFISSPIWTAIADAKLHTITVCPNINNDVPETLDTGDCNTGQFYVLPAVLYNSLTGKPSAAVGSSAPDGYGTNNFNSVLSILNRHRPLCPGPPEGVACPL